MSTTRAVWLFLFLLTGLRITLVGTTDLSFDEAHYWMWSERLAPAYFSKGPGVAFTIWSSTALFGDTEFGVRFWSPILGAATSLLLYYLARRLFSATTGLWVVIALNATPIFNIGTFVMTIDPLSVFFWVAAMFTFWLALERSPKFSWHWPLTGLLVGLGFLCKYTNALELISIVLVLALVPRWRTEFRKPGLYLLAAAFVLCTIPPLVWNYQKEWATVGHLRASGGLENPPGFHPTELLSFLGAHFGVYSPLIFLAVAWAVIAGWRRSHQQPKGIYLLWFGLPVFFLYAVLSLNEAANPNWDALAFPSLLLLACSYWRERIESRPALRRWPAFAIYLALPMSIIALHSELLYNPVQRAGFKFLGKDPTNRLRGWRSAAGAVEQARVEIEKQLGERVFVIADARDRASELSFYFKDKHRASPGHPEVYITESQAIQNQFSFWPRYDEFVAAPPRKTAADEDVYSEEDGMNPFEGRSAIFVQGNDRPMLARNIRAAFQSTEHYSTIEVRRFGRHLRTFQVFVCKNYRTLPL